MNASKIILAIVICILTGCKKQYSCECRNSGGVLVTYNLKETKTKAKSTCDKYNDEVNSIPWSESYCKLK